MLLLLPENVNTLATHTDQLLAVLRVTPERYADILLDEGMRYLDLYLEGDKASREVLVAMPEYWDWWRLAADKRNRHFFFEHHLNTWASQVGKWERSLLNKLFAELHAADMLKAEIKPPRHVMRPAIDTLREQVPVTNKRRTRK